MADSVGIHTYGIEHLIVQRWDGPTNPHVPVTIGKYCSIAANVVIITNGNHRANRVTTYPFAELGWVPLTNENASAYGKGPIIIGNDVWFGNNVTILSGVTIGDGAIIGAESVVTKDVGPYEVVGGNPARVVRKRFTEDTIQKLLQMKWWDWSEEKIRAAIPLLTKDDSCTEFLKVYSTRPSS